MQINLKNLILAAGLGASVAVTGLTGCVNTQDRTMGRYIDDKQIAREVKNTLDNDPVYKYDGVEVNTFRGVVQLSGFAETEDQRRRAADLARKVEGPVDVINNIALKPPPLMPTGRDARPTPQSTPAAPQGQGTTSPSNGTNRENRP